MQIISKSGKVYEMKYRKYGYTGAEPVVLIKKTYFKVFTFTYEHSLLNWGRSMNFSCVEAARPDDLRKWFTNTVNNYEDYQKAWEKYHKEQL